MSQQIEELTLIATKEGGKPYMDSKVEVQRAINGVKIAIEQMGSFKGTQIAMGHTQSSANRLAYTMKEPIGVLVSISAFNHPLNLAVHQTIPAIAKPLRRKQPCFVEENASKRAVMLLPFCLIQITLQK